MRQRKHNPLEVEIAELNLVPYMDIMVNLIMFMLVSMSSFIQMKIINVSVPAITADTSKPQTDEDEKQLQIVLGIVHQQGFLISVDGTFLEGTPEMKPTVAMKYDRKTSKEVYDFEQLTKKMEVVKAKQPSNTVVTIVPDTAVDYDTLVKVMDAIRRDSQKRILYPDVLLGVQ